MRQKTSPANNDMSVPASASALLIFCLVFFGSSLSFSAYQNNNHAPLTVKNPLMQPSLSPFESELTLSKGRFLVASRNMKDPRFSETVILLIEYSSQGAAGLIINRPTEVKLSSALPNMEKLKDVEDILYFGGPVNPFQMTMLIKSGYTQREAGHVFDDIYYSGSPAVLQQLLENPGKGDKFNIYLGYAGWTPRQLDSEVRRGDWHIMSTDTESIFDKDHTKLWKKLISRVTSEWVHQKSRSKNLSSRNQHLN